MNKILLTIVIPYKNTDVEKFRSLCLSICNSANKEVELLFINDKSNPERAEELYNVIQEVFKDTEFIVNTITVPETNPGGILQSRLLGFINAKGEFVWGIDSDDELYPYSISTLLNYIKHTNCDIITWRLPDKSSRESKYFKEIKNPIVWESKISKRESQMRFFKTREILGYTHCKALRKSLAIKSSTELRSLGYINLAEDQIFSSYWFKDLEGQTLLIPERLYNYLDPDCSGKLQNTEPRFQLANYNNVKSTRDAFKMFFDKHKDDLVIELTDYEIYRPQILYSISRVPSKELCTELFQQLVEEFGIERLKIYSECNNNCFHNFIIGLY